MNIVVLGAGTVGISISKLLCEQGHSVTVVDIDPGKTKLINEQLDVRAITGSASMSSVLFQAGIASADICLAVTGCDEVAILPGPAKQGIVGHLDALIGKKGGDPAKVREALLEKLPTYMVPKRIVFTTSVPRNPNGKIDRQAAKKLIGEEG